MISSFKQKDGRVGVLLWGALTKEPQFKTTKNGDPMAWFYVRYGFEPSKNPSDKPFSKSIKVLCYKEAAQSCQGLEAWENVLVCGELKESEFNGTKEFNVTAEIVLAPNAQVAAIAALNGIKSLQEKNGPSPAKEEKKDGYDDFEDVSVDDIFPGL